MSTLKGFLNQHQDYEQMDPTEASKITQHPPRTNLMAKSVESNIGTSTEFPVPEPVKTVQTHINEFSDDCLQKNYAVKQKDGGMLGFVDLLFHGTMQSFASGENPDAVLYIPEKPGWLPVKLTAKNTSNTCPAGTVGLLMTIGRTPIINTVLSSNVSETPKYYTMSINEGFNKLNFNVVSCKWSPETKDVWKSLKELYPHMRERNYGQLQLNPHEDPNKRNILQLHSGTLRKLLRQESFKSLLGRVPELSASSVSADQLEVGVINSIMDDMIRLYDEISLHQQIKCTIFNPGSTWSDTSKLDPKDCINRDVLFTSPFQVKIQFEVQYVRVEDK